MNITCYCVRFIVLVLYNKDPTPSIASTSESISYIRSDGDHMNSWAQADPCRCYLNNLNYCPRYGYLY